MLVLTEKSLPKFPHALSKEWPGFFYGLGVSPSRPEVMSTRIG
jgi:hypothetical protein